MVIGYLSQAFKKAFRGRYYAPFTKNRLNHDAAGLIIDQPFNSIQVTMGSELKAGKHRSQALVILGLGGC